MTGPVPLDDAGGRPHRELRRRPARRVRPEERVQAELAGAAADRHARAAAGNGPTLGWLVLPPRLAAGAGVLKEAARRRRPPACALHARG